MFDLSATTEDLAAACQRFQVQTLDLFGSAVNGKLGPDSDIDVLVSFQGNHDLFNRYMGLFDALRELFDRDVDLVMADSIRNPLFRDEVMANKVPIYAA